MNATGRLISIVDDDDSLRNSLANLIRSAGFRTQDFASADEFLGSDRARETDCLILDVRMPGMSGLALAKELAGEGVLLLATTGYDDEEARARSKAAGFHRHLVKPLDLEVLHGLLDNWTRTMAV